MATTISHQKNRIPDAPTQIIDRKKTLIFTFNGRQYSAYAGDTIASALAAAGVETFSRSFKYHRRRGLFCVSGDCPNCLVQVGDEPNVRSCKTPVMPDMEIKSQNAWPTLEMDMMSATQLVGRFLPVGFYYKTFMHPQALWPVYEKILRQAAGLGEIDSKSVPGYFDKVYKHADVVVVGGGPAGLEAALSASESGAKVLLIEDNPTLGGHLRYSSFYVDGQPAHAFTAAMADRIIAQDNIEVLYDTLAFGWYDHNWIGAVHGDRLIKIRAQALIVTAGAYENPLVFTNNDLPGIMLCSGAMRLLHLWGVRPGNRAVVVASNERGLQAALDMLAAGIEVVAAADMRADPEAHLMDALISAGVETLTGVMVKKATGGKRIESVELTVNGQMRQLQCDLLLLSTGYSPNNGLLFQAGSKLNWDASLNEFTPNHLPPNVFGAGEAVGTHHLEAIRLEGKLAGLRAAIASGSHDADTVHIRQAADDLAEELAQRKERRSPWTPPRTTAPESEKDFVCFCEDVTQADIRHAVEEGYDSIELLKRYSAISMGPCQGKMCNMAAMRICAQLTGQSIAETGTTTSRPPAQPVLMGALGGRLMEPVRVTPMHDWHVVQGAKMMNAGLWVRPEHYGDPTAEVQAVRERVGLIDISTLGKLHLRGSQVPALLEMVYTNRWQKLAVGRVRYGMMVNEEGIVMDDGVTARLSDDFYYMTTTSSGSTSVYEWIEWWLQSGWPYDVHIFKATELHAAMNLTGPRARDLLAKLVNNTDIRNDAFPYMHARETLIAGVPALLMRVGFTGELGYEIHVPAGNGLHLWKTLIETGGEFGISPFGVEAQRVLRLEKGHFIVGQDTDALTNPLEADMAWAVKLGKQDFLGKPALQMASKKGVEKQLVGFEVPSNLLPEEANQIVIPGDGPIGLEIIGRITSVRHSPTLNKVLGLCWLPPDQTQPGTEFNIRSRGKLLIGRVTEIPFYDPDGEKLRS